MRDNVFELRVGKFNTFQDALVGHLARLGAVDEEQLACGFVVIEWW